MKRASAGGVSIAYDDAGAGEPALLLLAGWCADRTVFRDLVPLLAKRQRALAVDWRGHGESGMPASDFGLAELVEDALAVLTDSGARTVVPVALAHAGWVAIELARRLGSRVPRLVLVEWLVLGAPPPFRDALAAMRSPERWRGAVDDIFDMWTAHAANPEVTRFVRGVMGSYGFDMWSRAAREIAVVYERERSPLQALARLDPPVETLHLYATPEDPAFLAAQKEFAAAHPWFHVERLAARSHFPMLEVPDAVAASVDRFLHAVPS